MQRLNYLNRSDLPIHELIQNSTWFDDVNPHYLEKLIPFFQPYSAPTGTIILKEGEPTNYFCLICTGIVDVVKESSSGKLKKLKTLGPDKIVGEMAFFDRGPSSTSVIAKTPAVLLVMDYDSFESLSANSPYIALNITIKLIRTISFRLRETSGKLIDLI
jgi:CRP/FNR family transcriptional regulator